MERYNRCPFVSGFFHLAYCFQDSSTLLHVSVLHSFLFFFLILFIYFWLCWVFFSVWGLSLVAASGGHSSLRCAGLSLSRPLLLRSTGSRRAGSVVVVRGPSCSAACGIFPDQGLNPCSLNRQADSQPLRHQGSPSFFFYGCRVVHCMDRPHCVYLFIRWWTFELFPCFGDCEQCCYEHVWTRIAWTLVFNSFGYISRSGIAGSYGDSTFNCLRTCQTALLSYCAELNDAFRGIALVSWNLLSTINVLSISIWELAGRPRIRY